MIFDGLRPTEHRDEPEPQEMSVDPLTGLPILTGGGLVGERGALALPAYYRAVRLKSDIISTLPLYAYDGDQRLDEDDQPDIIRQPDPNEGRTVTLMRLASSLILRGNGFALLGGHDALGFPRVAKVIPTEWVSYRMERDGSFTMLVNGNPVERHQLLHVRGLVLAGEPFGLSNVAVFRRTLGNIDQLEQFTGNYYRDNATPSGVIKNTGEDLSPDEQTKLKRQWISMQRGNREPVVLNRDLDYATVPMSADDAQFIETKVRSLTDIANMVGVPGYFVGAEQSTMTYTNTGQEGLHLSKLYLRSEIAAVEEAFSALLPAGITARFDLDDLHRADQKTLVDTLAVSLNAGIHGKDEARQTLHLPARDSAVVDGESLDPNLLNAIVAAAKAGFDAKQLMAALNMPAVDFTPPANPTRTEAP